MRTPPGTLIAASLGLFVAASPLQAASIADSGTPTTLAPYSGAPSTAARLKVKKPPRNPSMAHNGGSNVHNDSWMTDTYWSRGPIGRNPTTLSSYLGQRDCVSIAFDRRGRIVTACSNLSS